MKPIKIPLAKAAARMLRAAALWQLRVKAEHLDAAAEAASEHARAALRARTAYRRLVAFGRLLDEIGWSATRQPEIMLSIAEHAWATRRALDDLIADEDDIIAAARKDRDAGSEARAVERQRIARGLLRTLEDAIKDAKIEVRDPAAQGR